ncbi:MAG: alpha/beta fold hydrolase [Acidobacteriota bacterium]|nr:alpha/beta fold hydrolase [Acidobacteriota bacterium]
MSALSHVPLGLHFVEGGPVAGLALAERRVAAPRATVVAIHGALDRAGSFARLARRLEGVDLVAYDRRGYQGSRALGVGTLEDHVHDLTAVVRAQREGGRVVLFGHSYGGLVALSAATRDPALSDLVLAYESPLPWVLARPGTRPPLGGDPALEAERFFQRVMSPAAWERLSAAERESRRLDGPALLADLRSLSGPAPVDLAALETAAAYLHGDAVNAEYYRALGVALQRLNPGIDVVEVPGAGHGAHLSHPAALARLIEQMERR